MPVYQYDGQHYDLPDGLTNEQAISKIKSHLGQSDKEDGGFVDKLKGLGEATLSVSTGAAGALAAPVPTAMQAIDAATNGKFKDFDFEKQLGSNMERMTYSPRTKEGQDYAETAGEFINRNLVPLAPMLAMPHIGIKDAARAVEANRGKAIVDRPSVSAIEEKLNQIPNEKNDVPGQYSPPSSENPVIHVDSNGVASRGLPDEGMRAGRESAEAYFERQLDEQHKATKDKEFLGAKQEEMFGNPDLFELKQEEMAKPDEGPLPEMKQGDLFEPYTNSHREFDQLGNERKPLSFDEYKATVENLSREDTTRFQAPEDLKQGYEEYKATLDEKQGGLFDAPSQENAFKEAAYQDTVPAKVEEHPFVKKASERIAKQEALIEKLQAKVEEGKAVPSLLFRAEKDLEGLKTTAETARTNVETALRKRETPSSFSARTRKQGGGLLMDWGSKKNEEFLKRVPGLKEGLKDLLPDERTPEQFIKEEAKTPDLNQNLVQKGFNYLTKGGVYQTLKTHNPLIKKVVDRFLEADNRAKAETGALVHDKYAPAARALSKTEKADVWSVMRLAEDAGKPITPEMMKEAGFNEKQANYVKIHQDVMEPMYAKLSEAMKAAGLEPVSRRVAYAASKARGDFRHFVYDKDGSVIGVVGANTKGIHFTKGPLAGKGFGLAHDMARIKEKFPEATIGEQRYYGGTQSRNGTEAGFNQMLEFLSKNDPRLKEFVDMVNEMGREDAFNFMNAKSHTMAKKGIWGMEGRSLLKNAEQNAIDGMEAQVRYAETMIKWGELSKAVEDTKPLMDKDNGLNMPNAKSYLKNYTDNALGKNPTSVGRLFESLTGEFGKATGIGSTIPAKLATGAKTIVNGLLLGWANVPFLITNMVQPFKAMPEMKAFLESKGVKTTFDAGTGYSYMARAAIDMMKERTGGKLDAITEGALKYAKDNHVYSSDLFEAGNSVKKDAEYYWNKGTQFGASQIEQTTRKNFFLATTKMLADNGLTQKDGLYQAARRATDMAMNNYSHQEAPLAYTTMGSAGRMAYNLASYKHNELSRLSLFARELIKDKNAKPLAVALASQVAFAGLMGTVGYHEADAIVRMVSEAFGKPTSLTKMLLDSDVSKYFTYGMGAGVGLDMTSRLGMTVAPDSLANLAFPGSTKIGQAAVAVKDAAAHPNEFNIKNAVREMSPSSVTGMMDRTWFSGKDGKGQELAINRSKVEANAVRNETDKLYKTLGATGINESSQKALAYENKRIDKAYQDLRGKVIDNMAKTYFTSGKFDKADIEKYMKLQGDPTTLTADLEKVASAQKVPAQQIALLRNAASNSITALHRVMRQQGKEQYG